MITTPLLAETVGHSPSFIGCLVSSIATVTAVAVIATCTYLSVLFAGYISSSKYPPKLFDYCESML